jgi:hypothetical protein
MRCTRSFHYVKADSWWCCKNKQRISGHLAIAAQFSRRQQQQQQQQQV